MKIHILILVTLLFCGAAMAQAGRQERKPTLLPGAVAGQILIKEVSGNNIGNFSCSDMTVNVSRVGTGNWNRTSTATGNFGSRKCAFRVGEVPAGEPFVVVLTAKFPNACDERKFDTDTSFPLTIKGREQLKFNFTVNRIRCVQLR